MITNVIPTPRIAKIETLITTLRRLNHVANESGASALNIAVITTRIPRI